MSPNSSSLLHAPPSRSSARQLLSGGATVFTIIDTEEKNRAISLSANRNSSNHKHLCKTPPPRNVQKRAKTGLKVVKTELKLAKTALKLVKTCQNVPELAPSTRFPARAAPSAIINPHTS